MTRRTISAKRKEVYSQQMSKLDKGDLLSGMDIPLPSLCTIRVPHLNDIRGGTGIGFAAYYRHIHILSLDQEAAFSAMGLTDYWKRLPAEEQQAMGLFSVLAALPSSRQLLGEALSFFLCENVAYDERSGIFGLTTSGAGGHIQPAGAVTQENYDGIRDAILQVNCLAGTDTAPVKFRNQKAREIYEKVQLHKKALDKPRKGDGSVTLPNIIGAVAASHPSYNLLNIWDLTVYQLYDQFARLNRLHQIDISARRWAAWGKDPFDFALWYKDIDT